MYENFWAKEDFYLTVFRQSMQVKRQLRPSGLHKCSSTLSLGHRQLRLPAPLIQHFENMPKLHYCHCGVNSNALVYDV